MSVDRVFLQADIPKSVLFKVIELCEKNGMMFNDVIEEAILNILREQEVS